MPERYDPQEIKGRLPFLELLHIEGFEVRRSGPNFVICCPFHAERSPSFTVHARTPERGHCYGCGWDGDIFDFDQQRRGVGLSSSLERLASLASVRGVFFQSKIDASQVPQMTEVSAASAEKPPLPRMRGLRDDEIAALAALRGLGVSGVRAASKDRRVGYCVWPQFLNQSNAWIAFNDAAGAWVVTDSERRVAQFRRMDGGMYRTKAGGEIKAWTKGSPAWPLGASEIGRRAAVLLVEGGADMLAAYHFLEMFRRLDQVAVVAILGSSNRIAADALPFFERKRVRIMMDEDEPKFFKDQPENPPVFPGKEAAARWTEQLTGAGAAVETFSLAGLQKKDGGGRVKDLNDLAMVEEGAWVDEGLKEAFFDFDF